MGHEGSSRGAAELMAEDRRLHLGEPELGELTADRGDRRGAHLEHPAGVVVHDEVDVALAEAGVDVGETVPLVGKRSQRFGEQLEPGDLHRQLALAGRHDGAVDADPVAQVEGVECVVAVVAQLPPRDEQLDRVRLVADGRERQLALPAQQENAARHPHRDVGLGARFECAELGPQLGQGAVAVEAHRVRVDALFPKGGEVGQAAGPLGRYVERGGRPVVGWVVGSVGHPVDATCGYLARCAPLPWLRGRPDPHHGRRHPSRCSRSPGPEAARNRRPRPRVHRVGDPRRRRGPGGDGGALRLRRRELRRAGPRRIRWGVHARRPGTPRRGGRGRRRPTGCWSGGARRGVDGCHRGAAPRRHATSATSARRSPVSSR